MLEETKAKIERELRDYIRGIDKLYSLNSISPLLYRSIKEFLCRRGKRVRPLLFIIGYLGFAPKAPKGLYRSAVSLELLHDFMLVHDDIIDKSPTRRGEPSLHTLLNAYLRKHKNLKFNGQDLAIVAGDVLYAMALDAFLAVREDMQRKEKAMQKLIQAALYTGSGEFIELIEGMARLDELRKKDIYKIYDLKTANYTFGSPLSMGAILAGAGKKQTDILFQYGIAMGRAFQIKDDIIGVFGKESEIGKPNLTDLQEGKKTILIWQAYKNSHLRDKRIITKVLSRNAVNHDDLLKVREIIIRCGALKEAKNDVSRLIKQAKKLLDLSSMQPRWKRNLQDYIEKLLDLN